MSKKRFFVSLLLLLLFLEDWAFTVSDNIVANGGFETGDASGWKFGMVNRAVYPASVYPGAHSGNYWLDTSLCPQQNCPSEFGNSATIAYDVNENTVVGQRYTATIYYRSPQGGTIEFVVWALGGEQELFSYGNITGDSSWKKLELTFEIKKPGHNVLRLQVYMKDSSGNYQYQFDDLSLINKPWIVGHKYLYHHIPSGTYWGGPYSYDFEGWSECYVCSGPNKSANVRKIIGPEPWRREFGNGDCYTYPYLGVYDDSNVEFIKWYIQLQKNAGIEAWHIGFWSDALPQSPPSPPDNWYYGGWKELINDLIPYFREIGFKFYVVDEMVYNWGDPYRITPNTQRMKNHAIAVLKTFKNEQTYLRLTGKMVYFLPIIDCYLVQGKLSELNTALTEVEQELGEEVFWLGYTGDFNNYPQWANTKIKAFFDGYGLTGAIFDDGDTQQKINFYSYYAEVLRQNGSKGLVMGVMPSFTSQCFNGDTSRVYRRNYGNRFVKSIDVFQGIRPRPIIAFVTQAEWQEGKTIEPAVTWDQDNSTDPYKYLKMLSERLSKITFTIPALPPADKVDPLRAGEVYGRDAEFIGTFPAALIAGKSYLLPLGVKNTGEAPWTTQTLTEGTHGWYRLKVSFNGQESKYDLAAGDVIRKGETKTFSVSLSMPPQEGTYSFAAQMLQEGFTLFGSALSQPVKAVSPKNLLLDYGKTSNFRNLNTDNVVNTLDFGELIKTK